MKNFFTTFLLLIILNLNAQNVSRVYKVESKTFEIKKKYAVQEIILISDSTYVHKNYRLDNKSQKKIYRDFDCVKTEGTYKKEGAFYLFKPNNQNFEIGRYKISDNKIIYFYDWKKNKIRRGAEYKRI
ncbi:hypothetical protein [Flavobacterium sp. HJJ]|uniref:hypothetical protein n=1 Tax=Flavobacterium sp. HJJ TaxID=2783792 RepID=UPI00188A0716|nr:hypothetical protein [Flavobacterium sp. HJJ]MBF4473795.1 hypothetical protein [Flavobacterium sp. HJJ]